MLLSEIRKIAKPWLESHPTTIVKDHWRWQQLSPSSREALSLPRAGVLIGKRLVFQNGVSEINLGDATYIGITDDDHLEVRFGYSGYVIYQGV